MTDKARELLERALKNFCSAKLCSVNSMSSRAEMVRLMDESIEEIRAYLASEKQDQPEPVAYWDTLNNRLVPAVPLVSKRTCFKVEAVPLYLHPAPQRSFVRLSDEEVRKIWDSERVRKSQLWAIHFAEAIQDALEKAND